MIQLWPASSTVSHVSIRNKRWVSAGTHPNFWFYNGVCGSMPGFCLATLARKEKKRKSFGSALQCVYALL
jgi:hypothetical protein